MTLIEKGKVKLDDSVNRLIAPGALTVYEGKAADVKVKHIINMTAGIPHGSLDFANRTDVPQTDAQKDEYVRGIPIVVFPPGEVFEYSNYSMGVPELIIERVTKKPFAEYMKAEFFRPLCMKRTAVWLEPEADFSTARENFRLPSYISLVKKK